MIPDNHPAAQAVLDRLHAAASGDRKCRSERTASAGGGDALVRLGAFYLAVSQEEGRLLSILARAIKARKIVEFGASFGVSTIYLAAAAKENGGSLITTEVHPEKCATLRTSLDEAHLADTVTLLEGDARETLKGVSGPIDMLFLDGWKSAYHPVFTSCGNTCAPAL
jgi:predicted O-methyltransferase YrrM